MNIFDRAIEVVRNDITLAFDDIVHIEINRSKFAHLIQNKQVLLFDHKDDVDDVAMERADQICGVMLGNIKDAITSTVPNTFVNSISIADLLTPDAIDDIRSAACDDAFEEISKATFESDQKDTFVVVVDRDIAVLEYAAMVKEMGFRIYAPVV